MIAIMGRARAQKLSWQEPRRLATPGVHRFCDATSPSFTLGNMMTVTRRDDPNSSRLAEEEEEEIRLIGEPRPGKRFAVEA